MRNTLLIRRYAKAFLEFAIKNDMAEQGLADLEMLTDTLKQNRQLRNILSQPFISKDKKESIIKRIFEDKLSANTLKFIMLMLDKNRTNIIPLVVEAYRDMYYEYKNIAMVTITTAVKIDEDTQNRLLYCVKDKINGTVQIVNKVDQEIIGGFVVNYLDYQYDESIRTKLRNLQSIFSDNLYVKGY